MERPKRSLPLSTVLRFTVQKAKTTRLDASNSSQIQILILIRFTKIQSITSRKNRNARIYEKRFKLDDGSIDRLVR